MHTQVEFLAREYCPWWEGSPLALVLGLSRAGERLAVRKGNNPTRKESMNIHQSTRPRKARRSSLLRGCRRFVVDKDVRAGHAAEGEVTTPRVTRGSIKASLSEMPGEFVRRHSQPSGE